MKRSRLIDGIDELEEDVVPRFVSVHGDIRDLDEVLDEILGKDEQKRRFAKG